MQCAIYISNKSQYNEERYGKTIDGVPLSFQLNGIEHSTIHREQFYSICAYIYIYMIKNGLYSKNIKNIYTSFTLKANIRLKLFP